jgi:hypothetical protein
MIFDAMQINQAEGVAICDAHPNLDVFRLRLGRALNYEYNEDSQTGLFQRRDPKEGKKVIFGCSPILFNVAIYQVEPRSTLNEVFILVNDALLPIHTALQL